MATHRAEKIVEGPFHLKTKGAFEEALRAYAVEYTKALNSEDRYIAEITFEQMFDIVLLQLFKDKQRFQTKQHLLIEVRARLERLLQQQDVHNEQSFRELFDQCRRKLSPRGQARTPFSMRPQLLLLEENTRRSE